MKELPIIVPTHRATFSKIENQRLTYTSKTNRSFYFVIPKKNEKTFLKLNKISGELCIFQDKWFESRQTYNALLLSEEFWDRFRHFENILICQSDAILLKNCNNLVRKGYAYIGSPWNLKRCRSINGRIYDSYRKHVFFPFRGITVGNGGLSFRNVDAARQVISFLKGKKWGKTMLSGLDNEDLIFSYYFKKLKFPVPSEFEASEIFLERDAENLQDIPDVYGFHALNRYNRRLEQLILAEKTGRNLF